MADYNITIIPSRGAEAWNSLMLVNGEACRFDDYDYADPDFDRQQAMTRCTSIVDGCDFFVTGRGGEKPLPLCDVAMNLDSRKAWMLFADRQMVGGYAPLSAEAMLEISVHLGQNILKLSDPETGDVL